MSGVFPVEALSALSPQAQALLMNTAAGVGAASLPAPVGSTSSAGATPSPASTDFGALVSGGLEKINQQLMGNQTDLQRLATGDAQNLHQIMIGLEESRLSFQLMLQVRSRLLEAYQDIMKMPV